MAPSRSRPIAASSRPTLNGAGQRDVRLVGLCDRHLEGGSTMRVKLTLVALLVMASGAALTAQAGSGAAIGVRPSTLDGTVLATGSDYDVIQTSDGWIHYEYTDSLQNAESADASATGSSPDFHLVEYQGRPLTLDIDGVSGGCDFSGEISSDDFAPNTFNGATTSIVYYERGLRVNPNTCTIVFEAATISETSLVQAGISEPLDVELAAGTYTTRTVTDSGYVGSPPSSYEWVGYITAGHKDPPGLLVNSTKSRISWNWSGSCATSWVRLSRWSWLKSGWTDVTRYRDPYGTCARALLTKGKYKNGVFCFTNDTFTKHEVNFRAQGDPKSWASWSLQKWGGCSWLLSPWKAFHGY